MPALHPPLTLRAVADLNVEAPHERTHRRQFFLILRRHAGHVDRATAVRTRRRNRRRVDLVNLRRAPTAAVAAIRRAGPPSGTPAATLRPVLGKRRRLPATRPAGLVQLLLQALDLLLQAVVLSLQAVALALQPALLALQPLVLFAQASNPLSVGPWRETLAVVRHTRLMPYSRSKYNPKNWIFRGGPLTEDKSIWRVAVLAGDLALTFLGSVVIYLAIPFFDTLLGAALDRAFSLSIAFAPFLALYQLFTTDVEPSLAQVFADTLRGSSDSPLFFLTPFVWSTYFTSIWLWFFVAAEGVKTLGSWIGAWHGYVVRYMDIERRPFLSAGIVCACLATALLAMAAGAGAAHSSRRAAVVNGSPSTEDRVGSQEIHKLRVMAEEGDVAAQTELGQRYEDGRGVARNYMIASSWYRKAGELGYASAQAALGYMYFYGRGVVQDEEVAASWWRAAAEQGNARGQYNLGLLYENGQGGVRRNDAEALQWYRRAADQGYAEPKNMSEACTIVVAG